MSLRSYHKGGYCGMPGCEHRAEWLKRIEGDEDEGGVLEIPLCREHGTEAMEELTREPEA